MKTRKTFWVFLFVLASVLLGILLTHATIYLRVAYLSIIILLTSYIWTYYSIKGIIVKRNVRFNRLKVGEILIEQFEIENRLSIIKLWLEIKDECKVRGKTGSKVLSWIGPKQKRTYQSHTRLNIRGKYILGPTKISSGDPLGLFRNSSIFKADKSITVLPYTYQLNNFPSPKGLLAGGKVVGRRTHETTPQAFGVRDYYPGDPLNRIHWLYTMRRNKLMVKEFEQDPKADIWIFLDSEKGIHSRIKNEKEDHVDIPIWKQKTTTRYLMPQDSYEYAITSAGSIAEYYLRLGRAVGFVSSGQTNVLCTPERGERQHNRILETLAHIKDVGKLPLFALINLQAVNIARGSTVVVIASTKSLNLEIINRVMNMRRLNPIFVIMNEPTFNEIDTENRNVNSIKIYGSPIVIVNNNDDIGNKLEQGFKTPVKLSAVDR